MMELVWSHRRFLGSGKRRPVYRCVRFPECKGQHWAHPNGAPLGVPADGKTRALRKEVHEKLALRFDWTRKYQRERAYFLLSQHGFGHVGRMTAEECRKVLELLASGKL